MDCFDRLIDRAAPLAPIATGAEASARFEKDPGALVLAVVDDDGRPVGLLHRHSFIGPPAEDGRRCDAGVPVSLLMTYEPLVVDVEASVEDFRREMLAKRPGDLLRGFVVTQDGRYLGVGTALSLLQADDRAAQRRAEEAAEAAERLAQAEAVAQAAARAKSQFLGVMSHEIRTPLNGVLAVAQLLERQPLPADGRAYVRTITESSERLMRLLSDAIDLSRADSEGLDLAPEPTSLRDLMDEVQALWLARASEDGVALSVTYTGEPGLAAEIDPVRLKQVFSNLIGNALKFTRRGGVEAGLEASRQGGCLRLGGHVRDTGPGLDLTRLSEIFEPLTGERAEHGVGLGLAICRRIVQAMGGRIWAENNPGAGAVLRFEFDAPACQTRGEAEEAEEAARAPVLAGHVLIVDDNATNRMVAQTLVEMFGCSVETAQDGVEAVEAVARSDFDAILMDIRMPRMDGVGATRAIRELPGPARATPIIALTANADVEDARRYLAAGMAAVVEKPIKAERLLTALTEVLVPQTDHSAAAA